MKKYVTLIALIVITSFYSYGQTVIPETIPSGGPIGSLGSLITFATGGSATAMQENWGLNICGSSTQPVRVYNTSFLVGYQGYASDFGTGNAYISGNVGIGTTNTQGYQFAVNGTAIATSMTVKLYSAWPDYVFKPTYHLPTLSDVKTYIDKNHHLPDMPYEQEVAKNGINLGETNKLLTKKVEELTLYLIENDKENENQRKINQAQQNEINQMKIDLEALRKEIRKHQ